MNRVDCSFESYELLNVIECKQYFRHFEPNFIPSIYLSHSLSLSFSHSVSRFHFQMHLMLGNIFGTKILLAFSMRKMSHTRHNENTEHTLHFCIRVVYVCKSGPIGPPSKNGKGSLMLLPTILKDLMQAFSLFALAGWLPACLFHIPTYITSLVRGILNQVCTMFLCIKTPNVG